MSRDDFRVLMADVIRRSRALLKDTTRDYWADPLWNWSRDRLRKEERELDALEREMANE